MIPEELVKRQGKEFNQRENRKDGVAVAASLANGFDILCDSFYLRVLQDVERTVGKDSMLMPLSEVKTRKATNAQIYVYQIAESAALVRDKQYVVTDHDWYAEWLGQLIFAEADAETKVEANIRQQLAEYDSMEPDARRLAFTDVLADVLPPSCRAPLILFRLFPLSVHVATALAFDDNTTVAKLRRRQLSHLPAIGYCRHCEGAPLENGQQCRNCGNPLWKYRWLTAVD